MRLSWISVGWKLKPTASDASDASVSLSMFICWPNGSQRNLQSKAQPHEQHRQLYENNLVHFTVKSCRIKTTTIKTYQNRSHQRTVRLSIGWADSQNAMERLGATQETIRAPREPCGKRYGKIWERFGERLTKNEKKTNKIGTQQKQFLELCCSQLLKRTTTTISKPLLWCSGPYQ
jgi:DNA-directed RNA polymerase subunit N (RpoN/RPB10)